MNNNESTIKFRDLFSLFVNNLWIMLLAAVVVGGSIFTYNYTTYEPLYKSTGSIYILRQNAEEEKNSDYNSDFSLALSVVSDCTKLLTSRTVLNQVIEDNNLSYTYSELSSMISINNPSNTRYLEISATALTPEEAKIIVDSVCAIGKEQIVSIMGFNQVNIVDEGTLPVNPTNSRFSYTIILAAIAAFLFAYIIIVLIFIFDDRITDPEMLEKQLSLTVLAVIPNMHKEKVKDSSMYVGKTATKRQRYYAQNWRDNK